MIPDNILLFIILFILIYCMEDSFFGLFVLLIVSIVEVYGSAAAVTSQSEVIQVFLFVILVLYAFGSLIQWLDRKKKADAEKGLS